MNDKELLELAAKAAGHEFHFSREWHEVGAPQIKSSKRWIDWNPLTDDGDALRLAVKLKMVLDTDYNGGSIAGNATISCDYDNPEYGYKEGAGKKDPYAATRRAIVRAAAEIGRNMK